MLLQLQVENLALIEKLSVSFEKGLVVFSGETGAGKSVLISALSILVGERVKSEVIRGGATEAWVEALFDADKDDRVLAILKEWNLPIEEDGTA